MQGDRSLDAEVGVGQNKWFTPESLILSSIIEKWRNFFLVLHVVTSSVITQSNYNEEKLQGIVKKFLHA